VIPADIILLRSSDPQNICFIETANLDGESNLKQKEIVLNHDGWPFDLSDFRYYLRAEQPNIDLGSFHGSIHHFEDPKKSSSIYMKNMLLRGCVLRNTDSVIGMVVYAGNLLDYTVSQYCKKISRIRIRISIFRIRAVTPDTTEYTNLFWCCIFVQNRKKKQFVCAKY